MSVLFLRFYVNILCLLIGFVYFSEFNKENKIDQHAKSTIGGIGIEVDEEDSKFFEDLMNQMKRRTKRKEMTLKSVMSITKTGSLARIRNPPI